LLKATEEGQMQKDDIEKLLPQLLGVSDVAKLLGWQNKKVSVYKERKSFPDPIGEIGGRPVWWKEDIVKYQKTLEEKKENENGC
jgi:hypothetical protein